MKRFTLLGAAFLAVAPAFAQSVAATATTALPANIQADQAAVRQDLAALQEGSSNLRLAERAGNVGSLGMRNTILQIHRLQLRQDLDKLHVDAQSILQPDEAALMSALTKLSSDQTAGNTDALQADETAVQAAETQLRSDRKTVFGGLGLGMAFHHGQ